MDRAYHNGYGVSRRFLRVLTTTAEQPQASQGRIRARDVLEKLAVGIVLAILECQVPKAWKLALAEDPKHVGRRRERPLPSGFGREGNSTFAGKVPRLRIGGGFCHVDTRTNPP